MSKIAIIGGTGLARLKTLNIVHKQMVHTPYGAVSAPIITGEFENESVFFLARHGHGHTIPPHLINYQANIWALKSLGVEKIIAVAAVGGITSRAEPRRIVIPDQIIDYTYGRGHTYYEEEFTQDKHIDFTWPYSSGIRKSMILAAESLGMEVMPRGTYGATQGPRLETAAEINRLERDGCDIVGMTGMPEASLARELGMKYATCAVVANWAAGKAGDEVTMREIEENLIDGMKQVRALIGATLPLVVD